MSHTQYDLIDAFGYQVEVPEGFPWVAITRIGLGLSSALALVAFEEEPHMTKSGRWIATGNSEFVVLKGIPGNFNVALDNYLMKVNTPNALLENAQETIDRLTVILTDNSMDDEDKIHAIYCPEHGLLAEWIDATKALAAEELTDATETEQDEDDHPEAVKEMISFFEAQGLKVIAKRV